MERPRSQSVVQVRPSTIQSRASRLLQKVSNFKGRIRLTSSKKSKDDRDINSPYPSQTRSVDGYGRGAKPYMSHPMLALSGMIVEPFGSTDGDGDDSSSQTPSTRNSSSRSENRSPVFTSTSPTSRPPQSLSLTSKPVASTPGLQAGVAIATRIDGLPNVSGLGLYPRPAVKQPPAATGVSGSLITLKSTPDIIISDPPETTQRQSVDRLRSSSGVNSKLKTDVSNASLSAGPTVPRKPSRTRLKDARDIDEPGPSSRKLTSPPQPTRSPPSPPPPVPVPAAITHSFSLPLLQPQNTTETTPARRDLAPRLTLPPPNHRFSLSMSNGSPARLSPSVILRPPPLPIFNLPTLPPVVARDSESGTPSRERSGLRSMPELPHQGTDDGEDGDHDEDDEEYEDAEDTLRDTGSTISHEFEDENCPRPSMSSSFESTSHNPPGRTISHSRSSSYQHQTDLPEVDTSRLDLAFLDRPPPSPPDLKGKGKAKSGANDMNDWDPMRTPISVSPYNDYFSSRMRGDRSADKVQNRSRKDSVSPARTPRPEDAIRKVLPPVRTPDPMLGLAPPRPGMYKHASRSLIDVHTIEKKERVEKMVEEAAVKEERRRSIIVKGKMRESMIPTDVGVRELPSVDDDVEEDTTNEAKLQKRISMAPAYDSIPHPLRRRRSMPTYTEASEPPPYPFFAPFAHPMSASVKIQPRDDEGCERLPSYSNDIYIKSIVPRKMEFTAAGVQAKDRKWRRVMCVLEGTALKIYRCPAGSSGVSAIGEWWEKKVGVGDVSAPFGGTIPAPSAPKVAVPKLGDAGSDSTELHIPPPISPITPITPARAQPQLASQQLPPATRSRLNLAVHLLKPSRPHARSNSDVLAVPQRPRSPRSSLNIPRSSFGGSDSRPGSPSTTHHAASEQSVSLSVPSSSSQQFRSGSSSNSPSRSSFNSAGGLPDPDPADLIRIYTMQNAESGLGNDYVKRRNVIRVRVEGEQFLLQAKDVAGVVEWIEALQAAANIALDLDERVMPKGPLFPRRRRRRQGRRNESDAGNIAAIGGSSAVPTGEAHGITT